MALLPEMNASLLDMGKLRCVIDPGIHEGLRRNGNYVLFGFVMLWDKLSLVNPFPFILEDLFDAIRAEKRPAPP